MFGSQSINPLLTTMPERDKPLRCSKFHQRRLQRTHATFGRDQASDAAPPRNHRHPRVIRHTHFIYHAKNIA